MAIRQVIACYWCDHDAVAWMEWCVHEVPGAYGGGQLMAVIPLCSDHGEMIAVTIADIDSLPESRIS